MNRTKKLLAAILAAAAILSWGSLPAWADGESKGKEEVVYINLDSSGGVSSVSVVNIFDLARAGQIVDHGDYAAVRNMTGTEPVALEDGTVTIQAGPGRVYYEGELPDAAIPWRFDIRYFLDGQERDAADIAGMSGALEIRLSVGKDPDCKGDFFDDYALQATLTLDGDMCRDIDAPGATAANVGGDKQLTYTILPGRGADIVIKARVTDFAMEPIAINGVPLSLDVEVDDGALLEKVTELTDAVDTLNEGAEALSGGAADLQTGADALTAGTGAVQSGAASLESGAASLESGAYQLQAGLGTLNEQSGTLRDGSAAVLAGLQDIQKGLADGEITEADIAGMTTTLTDLGSQVTALTTVMGEMDTASETLANLGILYYPAAAGELKAAIDALPEGTDKEALNKVLGDLNAYNETLKTTLLSLSSIKSGINTSDLQRQLEEAGGYIEKLKTLTGSLGALKTGIDTLVGRYADLDQGIRDYTAGVASAYSGSGTLAWGASDLAAGSGELAAGAGSLTAGAAALSEGVGSLTEGAGQMAEGTAEMARQTDGMDGKIQDQIDQLLSGVTGGDGPVKSFVSWKNRDVAAVQFVIRTPPIERPAPSATEPAEEEQPGFLDKLKALF